MTKKKRQPAVFSLQLKRRLREGSVIMIMGLGVFLFAALVTYSPGDPGWSNSGYMPTVQNATGKTGAFFADVFFSLLGLNAYLMPIGLLTIGVMIYRELPLSSSMSRYGFTIRFAGAVMALLSSCGLVSLLLSDIAIRMPMSAGGFVGAFILESLRAPLSGLGAAIMMTATFCAGLTLFAGISWVKVLERIGRYSMQYAQASGRGLYFLGEKSWDFSQLAHERIKVIATPKLVEEAPLITPYEPVMALPEADYEPAPQPRQSSSSVPAPIERTPVQATKPKTWRVKTRRGAPPISVLEMPKEGYEKGFTDAQLNELSRAVELRLREFNAEVKVVAVKPGPVITRFEMELAAGLKVSKISSLAKDLARALSVVSVRVVEVIPGKPFVGLEIPNNNRQIVSLREILESEVYSKATSPLSLALGKDIAGQTIVADLARMPHLLVAGTTGSGKSVGINAMILSILFKSSPNDVRFIMVDPKMLELSVYEGIPHLLAPVVTDMKDAAQALRWCVAEMERRYQLLSALGVRNLKGFNRKVLDAMERGEPLVDPLWPENSSEPAPPLETLPSIVVVVDEFADMIMVVGKKVEELIARIAQKARAAGIHLILATQRPSVDVITGLIKANVPTRIAFQVSSRVDSRTILDQQGAEQLLGHGDMLFLPPGTGLPVRVHGAFVSDEEVHKVVAELKATAEPDYVDDLISHNISLSKTGQVITGDAAEYDDEDNAIYDQAVAIVTESRRATISYLQRRLKIGYNRAARLIERMESEGVVSAMQSNGAREVLAPPAVGV